MSTQRSESDGESDAIKSCIRIRPLNDSELESGSRIAWEVKGDSISSIPNDIRDIVHEFSYDKLISSEETNEDVYVKTTREIVTAAVDGFNGTIFAYGQTSSGKTHTIRGSYETPGLLPLAVGELFDILEKTPNRQFLVRACYLEIYNEEIKDLLEPSALPLKLRETVDNNFEVVGVHEQVVVSSDEVFMLMEDGDGHRSVGSTKMNQRSSRSHSLFRITIESSEASTRHRPQCGGLSCGLSVVGGHAASVCCARHLSGANHTESVHGADHTESVHGAKDTESVHGADHTESVHGANHTESVHGANHTESVHGADHT
eukprot:gene15508-18373_t